ncbi:hypothetical protein GUJ93_ZPchr0006g42306 [Zizania palustris]|uniref:Uncharacterized protein n=1 Tax=Zizania palustris TaxID=103762 RepID=A0A8J5VWJ7_ZIZPA|nr:hypothetical protein GUJ93_ZPchr0006g42306 [Zizania palustris]
MVIGGKRRRASAVEPESDVAPACRRWLALRLQMALHRCAGEQRASPSRARALYYTARSMQTSNVDAAMRASTRLRLRLRCSDVTM